MLALASGSGGRGLAMAVTVVETRRDAVAGAPRALSPTGGSAAPRGLRAGESGMEGVSYTMCRRIGAVRDLVGGRLRMGVPKPEGETALQ